MPLLRKMRLRAKRICGRLARAWQGCLNNALALAQGCEATDYEVATLKCRHCSNFVGSWTHLFLIPLAFALLRVGIVLYQMSLSRSRSRSFIVCSLLSDQTSKCVYTLHTRNYNGCSHCPSHGFLDADLRFVVLLALSMPIPGEACCSAVTVYLHISARACQAKVSRVA